MKQYLIVYQYNSVGLGIRVLAHVVVEADNARDAAAVAAEQLRDNPSQQVLSVTYMPGSM